MSSRRCRELAERLMPALQEMLGRRIEPSREEFQSQLFSLLKIVREMRKLSLEEMAQIINDSESPVQLAGMGRTDELGLTGIRYDTSGREALLILTVGAILEEIHDIVREREQKTVKMGS